jgi:chemotaxis protein CheX
VHASSVNPFLQAAAAVLEAKLATPFTRRKVGLEHKPYTTDDISVFAHVTGYGARGVSGIIVASMSVATACLIAGKLLDAEFIEFDRRVHACLFELAGAVAATTAGLLKDAGYTTTLSPPMPLIGRGTLIVGLDMPRLSITYATSFGDITLEVALRED